MVTDPQVPVVQVPVNEPAKPSELSPATCALKLEPVVCPDPPCVFWFACAYASVVPATAATATASSAATIANFVFIVINVLKKWYLRVVIQ